jgi:hypothetical protein
MRYVLFLPVAETRDGSLPPFPRPAPDGSAWFCVPQMADVLFQMLAEENLIR